GRHLVADALTVARARMMLRLELDEDVCVLLADVVALHVGEVDEDGLADVVVDGLDLVGRNDLSDLAVQLADEALGVIDAAADGRAVVQLELAGVDRREEVEPDEGGERAGGDGEDEKDEEGELRQAEHRAQRGGVDALKTLKRTVSPRVVALPPR